MEGKEFKYNAFISYRHEDLDKYVAENLHSLIETYKMPKPVVEKYNITDKNIRRVFRDQEELPLSANLEEPITEALKQSEFLIVICSPRLKESKWCKKEIETFIKFHGRSNILCVLIEGEPIDTFPKELLHYEIKEKSSESEEITKEIFCEPLAMDVRGNSKSEINKKLKTELIRIIAPMYNLDYDDIKRRHEERKMKTKVRIFKIIAFVSILFAIYSAILFFKIYVTSNKLKYDQAINLANSAEELLSKDDRKGAIEKAYQSVTKYNNISMPTTSQGLYELAESLGVYYIPDGFYAKSQLDTLGNIENIKISENNKYLLSYDGSNELVLWDLNNYTRVKTIFDELLSINKYTFIGNESFAYQNKNKDIIILDINGNELNTINLDYSIDSINSSNSGKYIEISDKNSIYIYETKNYSEIAVYKLDNDMEKNEEVYFDEKDENIIFSRYRKSDNRRSSIANLEIVTYNINKKEIINSININTTEIKKIIFKDDKLIVLSKKEANKNLNVIYYAILTSYNYKNGTIYYQKEFDREKPCCISMSKKSNTLLISLSSGLLYILDFNTGEIKARFDRGNVISSYDYEFSPKWPGYMDFESEYIAFMKNGYVCFIDVDLPQKFEADNALQFNGIFNFKLNNYEEILYADTNILAYTSEDNRIIIYGQLENKDIKEIEYEEKEYDYQNGLDEKKIIEEYNFKRKDRITDLCYSDDKKLLFVGYYDNTVEIYNNESKQLLTTIKGFRYIDKYLGKTENNEHIVIGNNGGYILNEHYELIANVPHLYDYNNLNPYKEIQNIMK